MNEGLFRQLEQQCNAEPIRCLIREIQGRNDIAKKEVNVSGTKSEVVAELKQAVQAGHAQRSEVLDLLRKTEETGHQHILLLKPAAMLVDSLDWRFETVKESLFDTNLVDEFPRFEYPTNGFIWNDFRQGSGEGWLGKAYGLERFRASLGLARVEEIDDGNKIEEVRQYEYRTTRAVLVANWRSSESILELRIDSQNMNTTKTIAERRDAMWDLLAPAINQSQAVGIDVAELLSNLVFQRKQPENRGVYTISRIELTDPRSGQIRVVPFSSEDFDNEPGREQALDAMMNANFLPSMVRMEWKADTAGSPSSMNENVSVVLTKTTNGPELRILKKITAEVYEYIFRQLRLRF